MNGATLLKDLSRAYANAGAYGDTIEEFVLRRDAYEAIVKVMQGLGRLSDGVALKTIYRVPVVVVEDLDDPFVAIRKSALVYQR